MWPWEHLSLGYLIYSGYSRYVHGECPARRDAVALAVGTQFPDLVDKPLAWTFGVLPSGLSLAHSLLVALPVCAASTLLARRAGRERIARAFWVGYFSHLLGDVLYPLATSGGAALGFLFWPVVRRPPSDRSGFLPQVASLAETFLEFLATPRGRVYLLLEAALLGLALVVWARDGFPGIRGGSGRDAATERQSS